MRRGLIIVALLFFLNSAQAVEFKPLELPKQRVVDQPEVQYVNANPETPKGLLNDPDYKFKGKVEYDEGGVLFLNDEDADELQVRLTAPKKFAKKSVFDEDKLFTKIEEQRRHQISTPNVDEYLGLEIFGTTEYKAGKHVTYGTTFGTELDTAQLEYRTKMFARYDNKFFGVMTALGKDAYTSSGRQMDSFYFVPELKLSEGVSLIDAFKANPEYDRFRNEVLVQYRPNIKHSRDRVELEAGLSQTNYYKTGELFYQFSVSTKFRF